MIQYISLIAHIVSVCLHQMFSDETNTKCKQIKNHLSALANNLNCFFYLFIVFGMSNCEADVRIQI